LSHLQQDLHLSLLFISHNLATVEHVSDRIAVMYLGRIVETAPTAQLFATPRHPYTQALFAAIPSPDPRQAQRPVLTSDEMPSPLNPPAGCHFHPRCPVAIDVCTRIVPRLRDYAPGSSVACHVAVAQLGLPDPIPEAYNSPSQSVRASL
jgi:oligopeptide/dipeptide ABC transporter ATP-binding protein